VDLDQRQVTYQLKSVFKDLESTLQEAKAV